MTGLFAMVVLLLSANGQHQIDEAFALPGILLADKHSVSCGKVAENGKGGRSIGDQFKATSDELQIEMCRIGGQLDEISQSAGEQASWMVEKYGTR
jgi:hypothetical protein